eukprot:3995658-Alexandrium_andersonii.AAC.1
MQPFSPLVKVSLGPQIQPEGAAAQARPRGQTALSAIQNRRKSENPDPHCQEQEAPREARRLLRLDLRQG